MRDIVLKGNRIKIELIILLFCFLIAFGINVYSIIKYHTKWEELFTHIHYVLLIAFIFYLILVLIRAVIYLIKSLLKKE
jgi:presenilin-like A22 family membrane protease